MSLCASCGTETGDAGICAYHHAVYNDTEWARFNAIWCAFIHRGQALPRLPKEERDPLLAEAVATAPAEGYFDE